MQASTASAMTPHSRPIKLPKLSVPKLFRIRSASKQKQNQPQFQTRTTTTIRNQINQPGLTDLACLCRRVSKKDSAGDFQGLKYSSLGKSNGQGRCNSLQTKNSVKHIKNQGYKLSDGTTNSSNDDEDNMSTQSYENNNINSLKSSCGLAVQNRINNKNKDQKIDPKNKIQKANKSININNSNTQNSILEMQKEHERNLQNLCNIARMFDPTLMMKLSNHNGNAGYSGNNNQGQGLTNTKTITNNDYGNKQRQKQKQHRKINIKILNQHIFQPTMNIKIKKSSDKYNKNKNKNKNNDNNQQYWNKVNESLILASCKTQQIDNQVSKDLREIYQTLVTE